MDPIYAVSISILQGGGQTEARAFISTHDDERQAMIKIEWEGLPKVSAQGSPGDWLYAILGRLLMTYDDHKVMLVEIDPSKTTDGHTGE